MGGLTSKQVEKHLTGASKGRTDAERHRHVIALRDGPPKGERVERIVEAGATDLVRHRMIPFVLGKIGGSEVEAELAKLLLDRDAQTRVNAAEVVSVYPKLSQACDDALAKLVELELPRKRGRTAAPEALRGLGMAQTPAALKALLAVDPDGFGVPAFRAEWLFAAGSYRSKKATALLKRYLKSEVPLERLAAVVGMLHNGAKGALAALRRELDDPEFLHAREAARRAHLLLKTKFVFNPTQLASLKKWWDKSQAELEKRAASLVTPTR